MNREPIFWTTTTPGFNDSDRARTIMVEGKRRTEKFPQRGHVGDYDDRKIAPGDRWMLVVRHDGHEVRAVLTNGAAHMDTATAYAQYVRVKGHRLGWYNPGQCPCALIATKELSKDAVVSDEVRNGTPCPPSSYSLKNRCPHSSAEQAARQAVHKAVQDERELAFKSKEDKILDAMREQTAALAKAASPGSMGISLEDAQRAGFASLEALRDHLMGLGKPAKK